MASGGEMVIDLTACGEDNLLPRHKQLSIISTLPFATLDAVCPVSSGGSATIHNLMLQN